MLVSRLFCIFVMVGLFASMSVCAGTSPQDDYTFSESRTAIPLSATHPIFTIKLKSNPTTGFSWYLQDYNAKLMTPVKHQYVVPHTKLLGAPGYEVWQFKANPAAFVVPQQSIIRFIYIRPWEKSEKPVEQVFTVTTLSH